MNELVSVKSNSFEYFEWFNRKESCKYVEQEIRKTYGIENLILLKL